MNPATNVHDPDVPRGAQPIATLVRASLATTIAVFPVFLLGALAVFMRRDLQYSTTMLGGFVSLWYFASAASSVWGGRLAERMGSGRGMATAAIGSVISLLGIALLAHRWWHLIPFLIVGGIANAITHPTANLALVRGIPEGRMGVAFGAKQSAVPVASLLGGLAVPVVGLTLGWRWGFIGAALLAVLFILSLPRGPRLTSIPPRRGRKGDVSIPPLVLLGLAGGLGVMATNPLAIFYVESAVSQGFSPAFAGIALAIGSLVAIAFRVIWGWIADRRAGSRLVLVSILAAAGAVGVTLLGQATSVWILAIATLLSFGAGWGWAGLLQVTVVTVNPGAPAEATGIVMTFMRIGGILGPLLMGALADRTSFAVTWVVGGALLLASAISVHFARFMIRRDIMQRSAVD